MENELEKLETTLMHMMLENLRYGNEIPSKIFISAIEGRLVTLDVGQWYPVVINQKKESSFYVFITIYIIIQVSKLSPCTWKMNWGSWRQHGNEIPGKILISAKEGRLVLDIYAIVTATLSAGSLCVEWV